jgi:hypothetical protein
MSADVGCGGGQRRAGRRQPGEVRGVDAGQVVRAAMIQRVAGRGLGAGGGRSGEPGHDEILAMPRNATSC